MICLHLAKISSKNPPQKVMTFVFFLNSTHHTWRKRFHVGTGDRAWSARFSYQTTRTMIQRRNKRLFGCQHLNCEGKKEVAAVRIHPFFGECPKKLGFWMTFCLFSFDKLHLLKFYPIFFWILTCPKTIRWCSAWRHDLKDLTPLKSKIFPRHLNGHHRALSTNFFIPVIGCGVKQWWKWVLDIWK